MTGSLRRAAGRAPIFVVGEEILWGKDRMDFIDEELARS
jgi:2-hydroxychromene-2-carboxylate isomerase